MPSDFHCRPARVLVLALCMLAPTSTVRGQEHEELLAPSVLEAPPVPRAATPLPTSVRVVLELILDASGGVVQAHARSVEPARDETPELIAAALAYIRSVRFSPARRAGQPIEARVNFEVLFPATDQEPARSSTAATTADAAAQPTKEHARAHTIVLSHGQSPGEPPEGGEPSQAASELGAVARVARRERSASSYTLELRDLPHGPHVVPADLARAAPGMFVIQHAGGGKANQYFLRGFDADHGTDIALTVDGVPVNLVSHGHGQGYADLNWVIPELVERVEVRKGPYDARDGDFATAGALDFQLVRSMPHKRVTTEVGMFHSYRALALGSDELGDVTIAGAAELTGTDGPFELEENLSRINLFARASGHVPAGDLSLTLTGYMSTWRASGQIPRRSVRAGALDRFGSVDPNEGGNSVRHNLIARYRSEQTRDQRWDMLGYATLYRFALYSNFTFYRDDPERGDMIRQTDRRSLVGMRLRYERDDKLGKVAFYSRLGFDLRNDRIANALARAPQRSVRELASAARIEESAAGAYLEQEVDWLRWLRTTLGVRADGLLFAVDDKRVVLDGPPQTGEKFASRVSPKASLILSPLSWLHVYGNFGFGFHSNDARGVIAGVTPLTRALGYETGLRLRPWRPFSLRASLFRVDLGSELVWVGDEGVTEASGPTRRDGIEADLHLDMLSWLSADGAFTLARAQFVDAPSGENEVPLAPRRFFTAKLNARHPLGPFGSVSVVNLGERPATEDRTLSASGFTRVDLSIGYTHPHFELALAFENLLNAAWRESQFANVSRLPGETGPEDCVQGSRSAFEGGVFVGCEDLHFTPGTPFAVRASASLLF